MRIGAYRISRAPFMDTVLWCPGCLHQREEKEGIVVYKGNAQSIWYLGCECPKPSGVF